MSENIDVRARITATNEASPVILKLLSDIRKLEGATKSFNASLGNLGRIGAASMATFSRTTDALAARMSGFAASTKAASRSITQDFKRANDLRLNDARRMYGQLESLERGYQRQIEHRVSAERRAERRIGMHGRDFGSARMPAPRVRSLVIGGAAVGGGVASAFAQRIKVDAAETKAAMFGDLSPSEIKKLRADFADRAGIRYGTGTAKAIEAAVEGLKAGIAKEFAGEFADLSLKAQAGLDVDAADTAKLLGRLSTQMPWSKKRFSAILNAVAVSNNATAADGREIVEAMRRSLSALVTTKMTPEQLTAIDSTGISLGIQPFKMGTFTSFLTSQVAGADSARGQQAKDLNHAAAALGFGGRSGMARSMRDNPIQAINQILESLAKMPEKLRTKVAKEIGGREWMDELLTLVLGRDKLKEVLKEIADKPGFLDKTALQKIKSLQGRWASISAALGLVWEKIGAGFELAFESISDAVIDLATNFNFDTIKSHFAALVDGLREGFGFKNWGEAIKSLASSFDAGTVAKWKGFAKGFAEGLSEIISTFKSAFTTFASIFGKGDAESLGNFTAKLLGLVVGLSLIAPAVNTLGAISLFIVSIGTVAGSAATSIGALFIALVSGLKWALGWVTDKIFGAFTGIVDPIVGAIKSIVTTTWDWIKGLFGLGGSSAGHGGGASGSWGPSATDFSGSRKMRTSEYSDGIVSKSKIPSFDGTGGSQATMSRSAFDSIFKRTAIAGQYDAIVAAANENGIPPALLAAVIAHETGRGRNVSANNVAGIMDSETGFRTKKGYATLDDGIAAAGRVIGKNYRVAGGDIGKMGQRYAPVGAANDPNGLNGNWAGGVTKFRNSLSGGVAGAGYAGIGDPVSAAEQYLGKNEYRDRAELTQLIGRDVAGRSNAWCASFVGVMLDRTGGKGTGSAVANSYLRYGQRILDKAGVQRGDVLVQSNGRGVDQPGGHVGLATGRTRMVDGKLQLEMLSGNDGDSVKESWRDASRLDVRRGLTSNVPPSAAIANVPLSNGATTNSLLQKHGSAVLSGAGGPVAININGNSHDPEALATLVQRRISEAINWQVHDVENA